MKVSEIYDKIKQQKLHKKVVPEEIETANSFSEEELIQKLGVIYWIFGPTYEETISFKKYRIEFLQILPNDKLDWGCLMRVQIHIYENNQPLMKENVVIEFWKSLGKKTEVNKISISCKDTDRKYNDCHWFQKIEYTLAKKWNSYFQEGESIETKKLEFLGVDRHLGTTGDMQEEDFYEAKKVIKKFDSCNTNVQTTYAEANELEVSVYIWSYHMKRTLLYALTNGTAYTVKNGKIYIWYKPLKGFEGSGFYRLKRFVYLEERKSIKYFLDEKEKLL